MTESTASRPGRLVVALVISAAILVIALVNVVLELQVVEQKAAAHISYREAIAKVKAETAQVAARSNARLVDQFVELAKLKNSEVSRATPAAEEEIGCIEEFIAADTVTLRIDNDRRVARYTVLDVYRGDEYLGLLLVTAAKAEGSAAQVVVQNTTFAPGDRLFRSQHQIVSEDN